MRKYNPNRCFSPDPVGKTLVYTVGGVPVNSVLLVRSREEALNFPTGRIELAVCPHTGFLTNRAFDADAVRYTDEYEETQGFSDTFSAFHRRLADDLIRRYDLRNRTVLEIGCGKGEFLTLLCDVGPNTGVGFDPSYRPERNRHPAADRVTFIRDFYSEDYSDVEADFVCCKMTLEHIPDVARFVGMVRRSIGDNPDTVVFFQVPDVRRVLKDLAFWDVYHEHCSYFSAGSLARLFRSQRFDVLSLWRDYDDQYLMIEARPQSETKDVLQARPEEESPDELRSEVAAFETRVADRIDAWRDLLHERYHRGEKIALWGGGSKAVAFLTTLGVRSEVCAIIDINPHKQGAYLPGTGHKVLGPEELIQIDPDIVLIMNSIYHDEIQEDLAAMHLDPALWHVDADPVWIRVTG
jgi:SAM-dependent methyltransferase